MSESNKVKVTVQIFGDTYTVQGDDDAAYIFEVAKFVDETLSAIQKKNVYLARVQAAVFGALSIADQYHKLKKDYDELLELLASADPPVGVDPTFRRRRKKG